MELWRQEKQESRRSETALQNGTVSCEHALEKSLEHAEPGSLDE